MAHKNFHTKRCARYTQCIHVSTHKLKLPDIHANKVQTPPQPPTQVELYIVVKCKNIYRVFYFICIYGNVHHTWYNIGNETKVSLIILKARYCLFLPQSLA